jgi:hypothetical protein
MLAYSAERKSQKIAFSSHIRSNKDIVFWPEFYIDIM